MCYCSPGSLSKDPILCTAYRRKAVGLQLGVRCRAAFKALLNQNVSNVVLSKVLSLESERDNTAGFADKCLPGDVPKGKYRCNAVDVPDAVLLAGLWR